VLTLINEITAGTVPMYNKYYIGLAVVGVADGTVPAVGANRRR
jgi:hypothetical protein